MVRNSPIPVDRLVLILLQVRALSSSRTAKKPSALCYSGFNPSIEFQADCITPQHPTACKLVWLIEITAMSETDILVGSMLGKKPLP